MRTMTIVDILGRRKEAFKATPLNVVLRRGPKPKIVGISTAKPPIIINTKRRILCELLRGSEVN
jgi:hypothetical protein